MASSEGPLEVLGGLLGAARRLLGASWVPLESLFRACGSEKGARGSQKGTEGSSLGGKSGAFPLVLVVFRGSSNFRMKGRKRSTSDKEVYVYATKYLLKLFELVSNV